MEMIGRLYTREEMKELLQHNIKLKEACTKMARMYTRKEIEEILVKLFGPGSDSGDSFYKRPNGEYGYNDIGYFCDGMKMFLEDLQYLEEQEENEKDKIKENCRNAIKGDHELKIKLVPASDLDNILHEMEKNGHKAIISPGDYFNMLFDCGLCSDSISEHMVVITEDNYNCIPYSKYKEMKEKSTE